MMEVHMKERREGGEGVEGKVAGWEGVEGWGGVVGWGWGGGKQRQPHTWSSFSSWLCRSFISGGRTNRPGRLLERLRSIGFAPLRNWYPKRASSLQESRTRSEGISENTV